MRASHRHILAALASVVAVRVGSAQTGHAAVAPGSTAGWNHHGPFHVCPDARSNAGCVVETGVLVRAGDRVEVRARGRVSFGGGVAVAPIAGTEEA
jgi:hypothetical protein